MREIFLVDKANQTKFERNTNVSLILYLRQEHALNIYLYICFPDLIFFIIFTFFELLFSIFVGLKRADSQ